MTRVFGLRSTLQAVGSLWLAAVILLLLMVAMACATVVEAAQGREIALATFYGSWWFTVLLGLFGLNVLASLLARWGSLRHRIGFVITHVSLLIILIGAAVTAAFAVDAYVNLAEGETAHAIVLDTSVLGLAAADQGRDHATLDLAGPPDAGIRRFSETAPPALMLAPVRLAVEALAPDSRQTHDVVDDNPVVNPAIKLQLDMAGNHIDRWCFADQPVGSGPMQILYRRAADSAELDRLLQEAPQSQPTGERLVRVEIGGEAFTHPIDACMETPCPLGDTGRTIRVLRYMPHAMVGADRQVRNASNEPVNPAIEVEISGPEGTIRRLAFARFPEFQSMHGGEDDTKVTFITSETSRSTAAPIEIIAGPQNALHARLTGEPGQTQIHTLSLNEPVETPWPHVTLRVLRQIDRARLVADVAPIEEPSDDAIPAVQLRVTAPQDFEQTFWLQKNHRHSVTTPAGVYNVSYENEQVPLDFNVTLDWFRVGTYPGTQRPRSFESSVTFFDPASGRKRSRVISMNHPATHDGYTFYQSSYHPNPSGKGMISTLSVARDPGQAIVFAGYGGLMLGMLWVLISRVRAGRREETPIAIETASKPARKPEAAAKR